MAAEIIVTIGGQQVDLDANTTENIAISYSLEGETDFQSKGSGTAFNQTFPATVNNDQVFNTFRNPDIIDLTPNNSYRNPRQSSITVQGYPVLVGKGLLKSGSQSMLPSRYEADFYGDNGDWLVAAQDYTLYDVLPTATHVFDETTQRDSWTSDGTNPAKSFVYAPVRYGRGFGDNDDNVLDIHLRPSLFIYWMIRRGFDKLGYTIKSEFFDTPLFRRLVMPWTWGDFLKLNSKLSELLRFKATGQPPVGTAGNVYRHEWGRGSGSGSEYIYFGQGTAATTFKMDNTNPALGFDNNGNYSYNAGTGQMTWTYQLANGQSFGTISARFGIMADGAAEADYNSDTSIYAEVYKNGSLLYNHLLFGIHAGTTQQGATDTSEQRAYNFTVSGLNPGDTVTVRFKANYGISGLGAGAARLSASYNQVQTDGSIKTKGTTFQLFGFSIDPGGIVDWKQLDVFKNYRWLDFLRGVCDIADIIPKTDSVSRIVVFEPAHPSSVGSSNYNGYFKADRIDWTQKRDILQEEVTTSFSDQERDYLFTMKADSADGGLNIFTQRYSVQAGLGKYRFPERFKEGNLTFENRFFSSVMHLKMSQWKGISLTAPAGITPQIICMVPENISNTSAGESENLFAPKIAFYKGMIYAPGSDSVGAWKYQSAIQNYFPFMFAVNYINGENDICLSYGDQYINTTIVPGLMKRFYLSRLAIMDHGVQYRPWMVLNHNDVANWFHRERIVIGNGHYLLINIDSWKPANPESTQVTMWKYVGKTATNVSRCYPSTTSMTTPTATLASEDVKYQSMYILPSDLPTLS